MRRAPLRRVHLALPSAASPLETPRLSSHHSISFPSPWVPSLGAQRTCRGQRSSGPRRLLADGGTTVYGCEHGGAMCVGPAAGLLPSPAMPAPSRRRVPVSSPCSARGRVESADGGNSLAVAERVAIAYPTTVDFDAQLRVFRLSNGAAQLAACSLPTVRLRSPLLQASPHLPFPPCSAPLVSRAFS